MQLATTEVVAIEELTADIRLMRLKLVEPTEVGFTPGQYVDITVPGSDVTRAFSMANTSSEGGELEFMIKVYEGGRFSGLLDSELEPGTELQIKGPFGVFMLRESSDADIVFIGGGAGMAPIYSLLTSIAEKGIERKATYYYGARTKADLFHLEEFQQLEERLPNFNFVPALSEASDDEDWDGETGLITEVVDRLEDDLSEAHAYLCGPPPMIDACIPVLESKGVTEEHIYFDKFTTSSDAEQEGIDEGVK